MTETTWTTDDSGMVSGAGLHDATVTSVAYSAGGDLILEYRKVSASAGAGRLVFEAVRELTISRWLDGAILSELFAWRAGSVPEGTWRIPDGGWNALFADRVLAPQARETAARIAARRPEPWLVVLDCSYGGQMAAVCNALRITEVA